MPWGGGPYNQIPFMSYEIKQPLLDLKKKLSEIRGSL